jgi:hypothetical protein
MYRKIERLKTPWVRMIFRRRLLRIALFTGLFSCLSVGMDGANPNRLCRLSRLQPFTKTTRAE